MRINHYRPVVLCLLLATASIARAESKPWVDDFPTFASTRDGARWIVGRSAFPCPSEAEAHDAAERDAIDQAAVRVRPLVGQFLDPQGEVWLRRRLGLELVIADRALSRVHRPYGDVWSESLLVDAPRDGLARVARDYSDWRNKRHRTIGSAVASIFGLSIAILLIYTALNAVTRGYFRGRLRTAAAMALALGLLVAVYAIRRVG
jgi:hypothetical protein